MLQEQETTIIKFCLEELTSTSEIYDQHYKIVHSQNETSDARIVAWRKMDEASKRYLVARDRLTAMGLQPIYDHEKRCYVVE